VLAEWKKMRERKQKENAVRKKEEEIILLPHELLLDYHISLSIINFTLRLHQNTISLPKFPLN
jgi:hypothetical protein